jgi:hypothetical protein
MRGRKWSSRSKKLKPDRRRHVEDGCCRFQRRLEAQGREATPMREGRGARPIPRFENYSLPPIASKSRAALRSKHVTPYSLRHPVRASPDSRSFAAPDQRASRWPRESRCPGARTRPGRAIRDLIVRRRGRATAIMVPSQHPQSASSHLYCAWLAQFFAVLNSQTTAERSHSCARRRRAVPCARSRAR